MVTVAKWIGIIAVTGRAHCQRQVAFFVIRYRVMVSPRGAKIGEGGPKTPKNDH